MLFSPGRTIHQPGKSYLLLQERPSLKTHVTLNHLTNLLEVHDENGNLLAVQESREHILDTEYQKRMVQRILPDGSSVMVEATIDPTKLLGWQFKKESPYLVDLVCQKIVEGMNLTQICKLPGYPTYAELCRWKRANSDIQKQLDNAKKDRAEHYRDQALDIIKSADKDDHQLAKMQSEGLLKIAGSDDREKYGGVKTAIEAAQPTVIQIYTGIVRPGDQPIRLAETEYKLQEKTQVSEDKDYAKG